MGAETKDKVFSVINQIGDDNTAAYCEDDVTDAADVVGEAKKARAERAKKERAESIEKTKKISQKMRENKLRQAKELRKQQMQDRKNAYEAAKRKRKNNAAKCVFIICISSSCFSYITIGVLAKLFLNPPEWLFAIVMGGLSFAIVSIHTIVYKFIRDEIYMK